MNNTWQRNSAGLLQLVSSLQTTGEEHEQQNQFPHIYISTTPNLFKNLRPQRQDTTDNDNDNDNNGTTETPVPSMQPFASTSLTAIPPCQLIPSALQSQSSQSTPNFHLPLHWTVFWDIENVMKPHKIPIWQFVRSLRIFITSIRHPNTSSSQTPTSDVITNITVVTNVNRIPADYRAELHASGVSLMHVQSSTRKDVADKAMLTDLCLLPVRQPPPLGIALISGDVDYSYAIARLSTLGYTTLVIVPDRHYSPLLASAAMYVAPVSDITNVAKNVELHGGRFASNLQQRISDTVMAKLRKKGGTGESIETNRVQASTDTMTGTVQQSADGGRAERGGRGGGRSGTRGGGQSRRRRRGGGGGDGGNSTFTANRSLETDTGTSANAGQTMMEPDPAITDTTNMRVHPTDESQPTMTTMTTTVAMTNTPSLSSSSSLHHTRLMILFFYFGFAVFVICFACYLFLLRWIGQSSKSNS